jgi:general secretion pathway protein D
MQHASRWRPVEVCPSYLLLGLIVGALLLPGCSPGSAAFRQGRKAELHKDYDSAVVDFERALQSEPDNAHFLIYDKEARLKASAFHQKQGERLLSEMRVEDAAGEFQKAVSIDPTNQAAAQQLDRILSAQAAEKAKRQEALKKAMETRVETVAPGGVQLKALPTAPLAHFHIVADSRRVFETLGKLAGINVVFFHDFQAKPVSLDLTNVKLADALRIASYEGAVFWKPITPNTILVIPDTPANRREQEDDVLKTVYLSNPLDPAGRTAILSALKQVIGAQRVFDNPQSNSIIIRDTPEKVEAAEQLIHSLDLGKAEVLIDITILEADRDRLRNLGLSPAPVTGNTQLAVGFNPPTSATTASGTTPVLPLNQLGKITTSEFSVVLPGAIANAVMSDTRTRILQNPQVRVTDGQTAKLRIGSRVPFATGSFGVPTAGVVGGGAGAGFGLLANTQFQYQDVGVNLDITPHVATDGQVDLKAKIEISSVGSPTNIGGVEEPTFTQRNIEHEIRLKEGEVSLLGGLIQTQTTRSVNGLPGLSDIPILRYFFSIENNEVVDNEVLIMMTPRVIRLPETPEHAEAQLKGEGTPAGFNPPYQLPGGPR